MPSILSDSGIRVFYQEDNFTDPWKNRPTLILQHGNGRSGLFWNRWIPYLAPHFRIIRPDMRGVGRSSGASLDVITIENCIKDLVQIIHQTQSGSVYFCGESMGGILGIILAAQHPELVKSLTLIATPVFINATMKERYALGFSSRLEAMRVLGIKDWVRKTSILTRFPPDAEPELIDWYVDEFAKSDPETLIRYSDLVSNASAQEFLPKIQCPTLAIFPQNGQITDAEQEKILVSQIANVQVAHIPSEFHMSHLTHVKECAQLLLAHLGVSRVV